MEIVSILLIIVPLSLCLGFHLFGEDLEHSYRQHRHHQMSPKVLPSTSRAKNESWSECSDHISVADSNFVAARPSRCQLSHARKCYRGYREIVISLHGVGPTDFCYRSHHHREIVIS